MYYILLNHDKVFYIKLKFFNRKWENTERIISKWHKKIFYFQNRKQDETLFINNESYLKYIVSRIFSFPKNQEKLLTNNKFWIWLLNLFNFLFFKEIPSIII